MEPQLHAGAGQLVMTWTRAVPGVGRAPPWAQCALCLRCRGVEAGCVPGTVAAQSIGGAGKTRIFGRTVVMVTGYVSICNQHACSGFGAVCPERGFWDS